MVCVKIFLERDGLRGEMAQEMREENSNQQLPRFHTPSPVYMQPHIVYSTRTPQNMESPTSTNSSATAITGTKIFQNLTENERISLFVLSTLSIPVTTISGRRNQHSHDGEIPVESRIEWNQRILSLFKEQFMISSDYYDAYKMISPTSYSDRQLTQEMSQVFFDIIQQHGGVPRQLLLGQIAIILILHGVYDARGRHLIRNLRQFLRITESEYLSLEVYLASAFLEIEDTLTRSKKPTENDSKLLKYAKIGAVGLGAGALLAFTGGLAAPAVAAAFVLLGGSTFVAAGLTSAAALASVFGTAGAGLAGYKMVPSPASHSPPSLHL
jgi:hypothetical protein